MGSVDREQRIAALEGQVERLIDYVADVLRMCQVREDVERWLHGEDMPSGRSTTADAVKARLRYGEADDSP